MPIGLSFPCTQNNTSIMTVDECAVSILILQSVTFEDICQLDLIQ
jgi:hypothetical protein